MEWAPHITAALAVAGAIWFSLRFAWWRKTVPFSRPRILMYHMIREPLPGGRFNKMRVSPEMFAKQIRWLAGNGWHFRFLSEVVSGARLPEKTIVLTFDDGYRDNLLHALSVLRKHNARATLFPVVKRDPGYDWSARKKSAHADGELGREPKLSDEEIRALLATGLIELGGHTLTHANLPALSDAEARAETAGCKLALEKTFHVPVKTFCYPFGLYGEREAALAREAGFTAAVTTQQGIPASEDAFGLPRVKISGTEGMFAFKLRIRTGLRS